MALLACQLVGRDLRMQLQLAAGQHTGALCVDWRMVAERTAQSLVPLLTLHKPALVCCLTWAVLTQCQLQQGSRGLSGSMVLACAGWWAGLPVWG